MQRYHILFSQLVQDGNWNEIWEWNPCVQSEIQSIKSITSFNEILASYTTPQIPGNSYLLKERDSSKGERRGPWQLLPKRKKASPIEGLLSNMGDYNMSEICWIHCSVIQKPDISTEISALGSSRKLTDNLYWKEVRYKSEIKLMVASSVRMFCLQSHQSSWGQFLFETTQNRNKREKKIRLLVSKPNKVP